MFSLSELTYRVFQRQELSNVGVVRKDYGEILEYVRSSITRNHHEELTKILGTDTCKPRLTGWIVKYLTQSKFATDQTNLAVIADAIFDDMAALGAMTRYVNDPEVEEVNVNGSGAIWVTSTKGKFLASERFASPEECVHILKKAMKFGSVTLDEAKPFGDSFISRGLRMTTVLAPCTEAEIGAICSIRRQRRTQVTRDNLILWGTALTEQLDLLELFVNSGVSMAFAGSTGSGKTGLMGYVLSTIVPTKRVVTIEDTSELDLRRYDENGKTINDVVQLLTKEPPRGVTMLDLLRTSLRLHPEILVPAEMRGEEALTVQEAGRTGHTICSTLHASSTLKAYDRILTMCLMSRTNLSEAKLLENIVDAFPIMIFMKQLRDGRRVISEIFEAEEVKEGQVSGRVLYRYLIDEVRHIDEGLAVYGKHYQVSDLSDRICQMLFEDGVPLARIRLYNQSFVPERSN